MKRFISPLAARTANLNGPNEDRRKLTKTGFRSPLVNASKKEKAKEPPDLPAPSQSIVIEQATNLQHVAATQDEQVLSKAEPTLPGTQISGTTLATAPLHKSTTSGLKKSKAFKAPAKAQHAVPEKGNKAGGQAHGSSGAGKSASRNGEPLATEATYYACLYFAKSKKKRPSQLDGVLQVSDTKCCLYSQEGKIVGKTTAKGCMNMTDGATLEIGMWELEVFNRLPASAFLDGSCFLATCLPSEASGRQTDCAEALGTSKPAGSKPFKNAVCMKHEIKVTSQSQRSFCRYALDETSTLLDRREVDGTTYAVVIDPFLAPKLRPHQKEGVRFMYRCIMELQTPSSSGCLLADEMGLGKTLQTLTLIWSLLKQGPLGKPAIRRAVVICPSSLVENWGNEVKKWLGQERLRALAIHAGTTAAEAKAKFDDFINGSVWPLLITSYELARKYSAKIAEAKCGLLVCDEAHRLKNSAGNKTIEALLSLSCARRVLLSGTPLQNNLSEFFAMMSFIAPELLGSLSTFKRLYADPIERSRDRTATEEEKLLGEARSAELNKRTQLFVLRRTSEVNAKYLPPRTEYVVFCKLQQAQIELYQALLRSQVVSSLLTSGTATTAHSVLATIGLLRKLCNHPYLLMPERTRGSPEEQEQAKLDGPAVINIPQEVQSALAAIVWVQHACNPGAVSELSGKFAALMALLQTVADHNTRSGDRDKVVVVSEWTATLDVIQEECARRSWHCLRLDGSTAVADRQSMVNRFNSGLGNETIFLLSKKAGGCGLNLIGAHRLVLFDSDWNPANDKQAMARIWRDGQTKPVVIYRLLSRGSIEEKIYQRQIAKDEVAAQVTGAPPAKKSAANQRHFSKEELRELFTLRTDTLCDTRDLVQGASSGNVHWEDASPQVTDWPLRAAIDGGLTTFVHQQLDQDDLGAEEEAVPQSSKLPSGTEKEGLRQSALQETKDGASSHGESKSLQPSAGAADSKGKRPTKRTKRVVCSDSEPEDCEDEKIFEELDNEEE